MTLSSELEENIVERIRALDNPILWGIILRYSKYYEHFFEKLLAEVELVVDDKIDRISKKEPMMYEEFWYILIFHNCPFLSNTLKNKITQFVKDITPDESKINLPSDVQIRETNRKRVFLTGGKYDLLIIGLHIELIKEPFLKITKKIK